MCQVGLRAATFRLSSRNKVIEKRPSNQQEAGPSPFRLDIDPQSLLAGETGRGQAVHSFPVKYNHGWELWPAQIWVPACGAGNGKDSMTHPPVCPVPSGMACLSCLEWPPSSEPRVGCSSGPREQSPQSPNQRTQDYELLVYNPQHEEKWCDTHPYRGLHEHGVVSHAGL